MSARRAGAALRQGLAHSRAIVDTPHSGDSNLNTRRCLLIADRIDVLLQARLGRGIDLQRMVAEPLYARYVLLVCDAHRGEELAQLAQRYRAAALEEPAEPPAAASEAGRGSSGFLSSLFDALRPARPEASSLPPDDHDAAARDELQRRAHDRSARPGWRR